MKEIPNVEAALGMFRKGEVNFLTDYKGDPAVLANIVEEDPILHL